MSSPRKQILDGHKREDVIQFVGGDNNIGVELGVAKGVFGQHMINSSKFSSIIGIDTYSELPHDTNEYKKTLLKLGLHSKYRILRMQFDQALNLFEDESLDFVYVDGYAHSGEDGGKTIFDWYKKVKIGGVIAGDDYDQTWPLVIEAVDEFIAQSGLDLMLTSVKGDDPYSQYPSWCVIKSFNKDIDLPDHLYKKGVKENVRVLHARKKWRRIRCLKALLISKIPDRYKRIIKKTLRI